MTDPTAPTPAGVDFYWRPGCGFCSRLERKLATADVPIVAHNIWEDPDAAAVVRAAARGNETVPTVGLGGEYLVNPSVAQVVALVERHAPQLLAD